MIRNSNHEIKEFHSGILLILIRNYTNEGILLIKEIYCRLIHRSTNIRHHLRILQNSKEYVAVI